MALVDTTIPVVVVVGTYGVGKSSFVKKLSNDININSYNNNNNNNNGNGNIMDSDTSQELIAQESELIIEPFTTLINNNEICIVDTAARQVTGTRQQMEEADLVIVLINAYEKDQTIDEDLNNYWLYQFNESSLQTPIIAVFNQIDRLNKNELNNIKEKYSKPTKEHYILETIKYCSAYTGEGINEVKQCIVDTINNVKELPRWCLIDPYTWELKPMFSSAIHRIFRLLDIDGDSVLNYNELLFFNQNILNEQFTPKIFNFFLRKLNKKNDSYVTVLGLTFLGFRHLIKRYAVVKKWDRCWEILRYFHYQNNLTLHPRIFPILPKRNNNENLELNINVYQLLSKLFYRFANSTIMDDENRSVASSMISQNINMQQHINRHSGFNLNDNDYPDIRLILSYIY